MLTASFLRLMRTGTAMPQGKVTVHAQDAEAGRETAFLQHTINVIAHIHAFDFSPIFGSITSDMIHREKRKMLFSTAGTERSAIRGKDFLLESLMTNLSDWLPSITIV